MVKLGAADGVVYAENSGRLVEEWEEWEEWEIWEDC